MERKIPLDDLFNKKNFIPAFIIAFVLIMVVFFRPFVIIKAGQRGVVFNNFKGIDTKKVLGEGMHFIVPFVETVYSMDVRVQKEDFSVTAASKDLQQVKSSVAVNYHLDPQKVANIYKDVGKNYVNKLISPGVQESVKAVTAQYNATSLIAKRNDVKEKVFAYLLKRLKNYNIIVDDVSITDFTFSEEFIKAIEAKQISEQRALQKQYELQQAKQDAAIEVARAQGRKKATIAKAQGEAQAQKLLRASVSAEIIKLKQIQAQMDAIKKWDGKMPQVTGGSMPMFNIKGIINR